MVKLNKEVGRTTKTLKKEAFEVNESETEFPNNFLLKTRRFEG